MFTVLTQLIFYQAASKPINIPNFYFENIVPLSIAWLIPVKNFLNIIYLIRVVTINQDGLPESPGKPLTSSLIQSVIILRNQNYIQINYYQ